MAQLYLKRKTGDPVFGSDNLYQGEIGMVGSYFAWGPNSGGTTAVNAIFAAGQNISNIFTQNSIFRSATNSISFQDNLANEYYRVETGRIKVTHPTGFAFAQDDVVDKAYVDAMAQGLVIHPAVKLATSATIVLNGLVQVDGITPAAGDRILVKNQSGNSTIPNATHGIYIASTLAWSRATDFTGVWDTEIYRAYVFVDQGTTNANTSWVSNANSGGTINSTTFAYSQFSAVGAASHPDEITLTHDGSNIWSVKDEGITFAKMQHSAAAGLSVIGRNIASAGDFAEISAASDNYVLRRSGSTLAFGQVANAGLVNSYLILGSTTLTLGGTTTSLAGLVSITTGYIYSTTITASGTISAAQVIASGTITAGTGLMLWQIIASSSSSLIFSSTGGGTISLPSIGSSSTRTIAFAEDVSGLLPVTISKATYGFSIAGGTTSKTLGMYTNTTFGVDGTASGDLTIKSSDTNARTLILAASATIGTLNPGISIVSATGTLTTSNTTAGYILLSNGTTAAPIWSTTTIGGAAYQSSTYYSISTHTHAYSLVTVNNTSYPNSSIAFYAPVTGGTSGFIILGNGITAAPVWSSTAIGSAAYQATTAFAAASHNQAVLNGVTTTLPSFYAATTGGTTGFIILGAGITSSPIWSSTAIGSAAYQATTYFSISTHTHAYSLVNLNGTAATNATATFFAPVTGGTLNYILTAQGVSATPIWSNNLSVGSITTSGAINSGGTVSVGTGLMLWQIIASSSSSLVFSSTGGGTISLPAIGSSSTRTIAFNEDLSFTLIDDILDGATNKYSPYTTAANGTLYTLSTPAIPTNTANSLHYGGKFYASYFEGIIDCGVWS